MSYQTTYYYDSRAAARQFARQAAGIAGSATLTETEGYWGQDGFSLTIEEGATVVVLHVGGVVSGSLNALAKQAASDYGEPEVRRVTVEVLNAEELQAHNYNEKAAEEQQAVRERR